MDATDLPEWAPKIEDMETLLSKLAILAERNEKLKKTVATKREDDISLNEAQQLELAANSSESLSEDLATTHHQVSVVKEKLQHAAEALGSSSELPLEKIPDLATQKPQSSHSLYAHLSEEKLRDISKNAQEAATRTAGTGQLIPTPSSNPVLTELADLLDSASKTLTNIANTIKSFLPSS